MQCYLVEIKIRPSRHSFHRNLCCMLLLQSIGRENYRCTTCGQTMRAENMILWSVYNYDWTCHRQISLTPSLSYIYIGMLLSVFCALWNFLNISCEKKFIEYQSFFSLMFCIFYLKAAFIINYNACFDAEIEFDVRKDREIFECIEILIDAVYWGILINWNFFISFNCKALMLIQTIIFKQTLKYLHWYLPFPYWFCTSQA